MKPYTDSESDGSSLFCRLSASLRFSAICILTVLAADAFAANKNWTGAVSSDWNNVNNWQGNVFPGALNSIIIDPLNYTNAPVISANSAIGTFKLLTVQNAGVLTIQANLTVGGTLKVTGANSRIDMSAGT